MPAVTIFISALWAVFWIYWLIAAVGVKVGSPRSRPTRPIGLLIVLLCGLTIRALEGTNGLAVDNAAVESVGEILLVSGLGLAVWARVHLGRNWGMPMTEKAEPELVTSGPYRFVRHPMYSGLLLGILGTAWPPICTGCSPSGRRLPISATARRWRNDCSPRRSRMLTRAIGLTRRC